MRAETVELKQGTGQCVFYQSESIRTKLSEGEWMSLVMPEEENSHICQKFSYKIFGHKKW